jgi:hypothetical protein
MNKYVYAPVSFEARAVAAVLAVMASSVVVGGVGSLFVGLPPHARAPEARALGHPPAAASAVAREAVVGCAAPQKPRV